MAAQALALRLSIPLITGGTDAQSVSVDFFCGRGCLFCATDLNKEVVDQLSPSLIEGYKDLTFLPKNDNPVGQSNVFLCLLCCEMIVSRFVSWVCQFDGRPPRSQRTIFHSGSFESVTFEVPKSAKCRYCDPGGELFRIIHFNDVYDIEEGDKAPEGGAHNFKPMIEQCRADKDIPSITLFSGDAFSPSTLGFIERGQQMIEPLNALKIDAACYGNHDFDYPVQETIALKKQTKFPWLLANFRNAQTDSLFGEAEQKTILYVADLKIGVVGIGQESWAGLVHPENQDLIIASPGIEVCRNVAKGLREQDRCDLVVALTHASNDFDRSLAAEVLDVDLVLGGHTHVVLQENINGTLLIKSGCNFRNFSVISFYHEVRAHNEGTQKLRCGLTAEVKVVQVGKQENPDKALLEHAQKLLSKSLHSLDKILGFTDVDLDCRFEAVRSGECLIGNFVTDLFKAYANSDLAFVNSGFIRHEKVIPAGPILVKELFKFIVDDVGVKRLSGREIVTLLEDGLSAYPALEGRFPSVAGIKVEFNPEKPPYSRVVRVMTQDGPLDQSRTYTVAGNCFILDGNDGYSSLKRTPPCTAQGLRNIDVILNFFRSISSNKSEEEKELSLKHMKTKMSCVFRFNQLVERLVDTEVDGQIERFIAIKPQFEGRVKAVAH